MNEKIYRALHCVSYAGLALTLSGIVRSIKNRNRMLICSPMMDDGLANPIMDYLEKHPGASITKELGEQILRDAKKKS